MVDRDEIAQVAANARLDFDEDEIMSLQDDLDDILDAFASLDEIDTSGVEPAFHPIDIDTAARPDDPGDCLPQDAALQNTENTEDGYFKGPRSV